jgi:antibiotic biosynthesis monooxygenase (ABM) superfamily enzyme
VREINSTALRTHTVGAYALRSRTVPDSVDEKPHSPPDINAIVTGIIVHRIRPGTEALYDAWLNDIREASRRFPGYLSTDVIRPIPGLWQYTVILRFENFKTLSDWMGSDVRHSFLKRIEAILEDADRYEIRTGIDFLLDPPGRARRPVRWKQFLISWLMIAPFAVLVPWLLRPLSDIVPVLGSPLVNRVVVAGCCVFLMVYVLMPPFARALSKWLFR